MAGLTQSALAAMIDHTLLKPEATRPEIEKLCREAIQYGFASVCVNPFRVEAAAKFLLRSEVKVCTVIGFPLGASWPTVKATEAREAVSRGAGELDMVLNIGALKDGVFNEVEDDIAAVVEASSGRLVKVIFETCLLTDEEIVKACELSLSAGAGFVKTSTGFSTGSAKVEAVALMRKTVGVRAGVKASGGIRDQATLMAMIDAGASRIGTSSGVAIIEKQRAAEGTY